MRCVMAGGWRHGLAVAALALALCGTSALSSSAGTALAEGASGPVLPIPDTLWQLGAGLVPANGNYVYLESDPGDYIGAGRAYLYVPATAVLSVAASGGLLSVNVNGDDWWYGRFQAMNTLTNLEPGFYPGLQRYPFHNPTQGGLDWSGEGRGSNTLTGWFAIDSVTYVNDALTAIDLRFEQHSEGATPALHGAIHWQAGDALPQRATTLTLSAPSVCKYGSAVLSGSLKSVATNPLADTTVIIRYWSGAWTTLGSATTDAGGAFAVAAAPTTKTTYQAIFAGDDSNAGSTTATATLLPMVFLSKPAAPTSTRTTTTFSCSCYLKPRHVAGSYPVSFECQRYVSGHWVKKKTVKARAANYASYTKCSARIRLGTTGSWRIRAVHTLDSRYAATKGSWLSVKVR